MFLKWKQKGEDASYRSPGTSAMRRGRNSEPRRLFGLFLGEFCD